MAVAGRGVWLGMADEGIDVPGSFRAGSATGVPIAAKLGGIHSAICPESKRYPTAEPHTIKVKTADRSMTRVLFDFFRWVAGLSGLLTLGDTSAVDDEDNSHFGKLLG